MLILSSHRFKLQRVHDARKGVINNAERGWSLDHFNMSTKNTAVGPAHSSHRLEDTTPPICKQPSQ